MIKAKTMAVAVHDGYEWLLFPPGAAAARTFAGDARRIPDGLMDALSALRAKSVRFLLAGEIHSFNTTSARYPFFDRVNARFAEELADTVGLEAENVVTAGTWSETALSRPGRAVAGVFELGRLSAYRERLRDAGLAFAGVAPLELALNQAAAQDGADERGVLIVAGAAHTLIIPRRRLPECDGPVSIPSGTRLLVSVPEDWCARCRRALRALERASAVELVVLGAGNAPDAAALGVAKLVTRDAAALIAAAAQSARAERSRNLRAAVPIANPWEPRKRFSHAFIVLPALLILSAPFVWGAWRDRAAAEATRRYTAAAAKYLPLERRIDAATNAKNRAENDLRREKAREEALAGRRRPLAAFVHAAYFFSKHAGNSLTLESIEDTGGVIAVKGVYTDPEDELALNEELEKFCGKTGLKTVSNRSVESRDGEGAVTTALELKLDYTGVR